MGKIGVKGELTSTQLATIILVLIGFVIAALFIWSVFGNKDLSERELCRLSVLTRATVPSVAEQIAPLNCFTEKICITVDKSFVEEVKDRFTRNAAAIGLSSKQSECKQFAGEENVRNVEVDLDKPLKASETIQREVANAMFDCWMMMGQGKMDIFSGKTEDGILDFGADWASISIQSVKPTCLVCSRVAFSEAFMSEENKDKRRALNIDYNKFLSQTKVRNSALTYMKTFTDEGVGNVYGAIEQTENKLAPYIGKTDLTPQEIRIIKDILKEQAKGNEAEIENIESLSDDKIRDLISNLTNAKSSDQIAIVFTQIKVSNVNETDQFWTTLKNGAILSGTVGLSGPGKFLGLLGFTPFGKILTLIAGVGGVSTYLAYQAEYQTHANQALAATTCGKFESTNKDGTQTGCSLVKLMNWNVNEVNGLCTGGIQGNL